MKEQSENRRALPKFFLTMLGSLLVGGAAGFVIGLGHIFGWICQTRRYGWSALFIPQRPGRSR